MAIDKDELVRLAERCEAATGDSFDLNHAIALALGIASEPLTASLDAAMTLVEEGWALNLKETTQGDQNDYTGDSWLPNWSAALIQHRHTGYKVDQRGHWRHGTGETPALALCAAALRARSPEGDGE